MFLLYFHLPVCYDEGVEILLSRRQNTTTHIMDRIHEWHRHHSLCEIQLDGCIFLDWFLKTLLPLSPRMLHSITHKLRMKQSSKHNSSTLYMPKWVTFTLSTLMLLVMAPLNKIRWGNPMLLMESSSLSDRTLSSTQPLP